MPMFCDGKRWQSNGEGRRKHRRDRALHRVFHFGVLFNTKA
jgi:hypothetical protein